MNGIIQAALDADSGERLQRCLPMLSSAVDNWVLSERSAPPGYLAVAAATPKGGIVVHAAAWPDLDEATASRSSSAAVAVAVARAIESPSSAADTIITGAAVLLGHAGIAACEADAGRMKKPLTIVLVEREDEVISWLITTVEIPLH